MSTIQSLYTEELSEIFLRIEQRYLRLGSNQDRAQSFIKHLQSLAHWEEDPLDYPDTAIAFPDKIDVAFAVCHPSCGSQDLVVDGSTQECQRCGSLLFRLATSGYQKIQNGDEKP